MERERERERGAIATATAIFLGSHECCELIDV